MTDRDLKTLEAYANQRRPSKTPKLDEEEQRLAQRVIDQLDESVSLSESALRSLGVLLEAHDLPTALVGALGFSVTELRSQLPALRRAATAVSK